MWLTHGKCSYIIFELEYISFNDMSVMHIVLQGQFLHKYTICVCVYMCV